MVRVAITGAAGNVGRVVADVFEDSTLFVHEEHEDIDGVQLDVTDRDAFVEKLSDEDVLIHLAGASSPYAEWDDLHRVNVGGTYNAFHAAVENDVDRVVYASSNHAVNATSVVEPAEPETLREDAEEVDHDDPPRPDTFYGVSKVASEALGNFFATRYGVEVVNVRIGWLMSKSDLVENVRKPEGDHPEALARFARAMWLSKRDCREAMRASATADLPENPLTVHAVSRNDDRILSLTHTQRSIGYEPRDNATETLIEADVET